MARILLASLLIWLAIFLAIFNEIEDALTSIALALALAPPFLRLATAVDDFGTTVPIGWPALAFRARHLEVL